MTNTIIKSKVFPFYIGALIMLAIIHIESYLVEMNVAITVANIFGITLIFLLIVSFEYKDSGDCFD